MFIILCFLLKLCFQIKFGKCSVDIQKNGRFTFYTENLQKIRSAELKSFFKEFKGFQEF